MNARNRTSLAEIAPDVDWPPLRPFWAAARQRELRLPRCDMCSRFNWYPGPQCRVCGNGGFTWEKLSGNGTLFSWTVVRHALHPAFAPFVPYVAGIVTIAEDEQVRMVSRLLAAPDQPLKPGLPARAEFVDLGHPIMETGIAGVVWSITQEG